MPLNPSFPPPSQSSSPSPQTPEAKAALQQIARATGDGWSILNQGSEDPTLALLRDHMHRAAAQERRHERITWAEKCAVWNRIGFQLYPKEEVIARDQTTIRVARLGRRAGKTYLAAMEAIAVMIAKPGSFGWIVAPDMEQTSRCWEMVMVAIDKLVALGVVQIRRKQSSASRMHVELSNGSVAEGQSAKEGAGLQGVGLDWLIVDEIGQIESWILLRIMMPAVLQRHGWIFLIGTPLGDSWATAEARNDKRHALRTGDTPMWKEFIYESWHNTFEFPGGRDDPAIRDMERTMLYEDFMEQICAQPQLSRLMTYKEFDEDVHVRACPFNAKLPVFLVVDPSTGVNPYAVAAFQDYGSFVNMIDEYYHLSVLAQDVIAALVERPWWSRVQQVIIDDAWPQEVKLWQRDKRTRTIAIRRANKSQTIEESIPLVRQWLRDPLQWNRIVTPLRDQWVERMFPGKVWAELDYEDQAQVIVRADYDADQDKAAIVNCARFFVDRRCRNAIEEVQSYMHRRPRKDDRNAPERPVEYKDHLMDCWRYFLWNQKRYFGLKRANPVDYLSVVA